MKTTQERKDSLWGNMTAGDITQKEITSALDAGISPNLIKSQLRCASIAERRPARRATLNRLAKKL